MMAVDLSLYALIDPQRTGGRAPADLARQLAAGGATLVQLRDKNGTTKEMIAAARALAAALAPARVPLLVNDRVDVALAAEADGVHLGQDDMPVADARLLLGRVAIIGLSIKSVPQAQAAPIEQLDYVAVGGVFATASKDNPDPPIGLDGLRKIVAAIRARSPRLPICAIAGIDATNAADVIAAGADGIAAISALALAPDPKQAALNLRAIVARARLQRGGA
jgi:thiamine-phosphate pyrophosphorylase